MEKDTAISELQRVAKLLDSRSVSRSTFDDRGTITSAAIEATFGSWNEASVAAGLTPLPQGGLPKSEARRQERLTTLVTGRLVASDEELLDDLSRVATLIGRRPSGIPMYHGRQLFAYDSAVRGYRDELRNDGWIEEA